MHNINSVQFNQRQQILTKISVKDGEVSFRFTPDDWHALESDASEINKKLARAINCLTAGVELMALGFQAINYYSGSGDASPEAVDLLCHILAEVTGDNDFQKGGRHYRDYIDGWRPVSDVTVRDGFLWIGEPEDAPLPEQVKRSNKLRDCRPYGAGGVGVSIHQMRDGKFRVEAKYREDVLIAIRVIFQD